MQLSLSGTRQIPAPAERVWARLLDPAALTEGSSAVESVETIGPGHFRVTVALGFGFFKVRVPVEVTHADLVAPERGTMRVRGEAMGTTVGATATFVLHPEGGGVRLEWKAEGSADGKLARVAGEALEGTARRLAEEFWDDFTAKVTRVPA
jgi:carbon monoxide dehydrogenase subunit G